MTLLGRNRNALETLAAELQAAESDADILVGDAADPAAFRRLLEDFATSAAPDVLVYNAALVTADDLVSGSTSQFVDAYAVDVVGAISAVQVFVPGMLNNKAGTVLLTEGGLSLSPHPAYASVSLGKTTLRAMASLLHDQLAPLDVHVTRVTIAGAILHETPFAPERIADAYWQLHTQKPSNWTADLLYSPDK